MVDYKELAYERINQVEEMLKSYEVLPRNFTYINLFQSLQQLYFQEQYRKVIAISDILIVLDGVEEKRELNDRKLNI